MARVTYRDVLKFSPQYKMGFKVLDEMQMENIFPNYGNLLERFRIHRNELSKLNGSYDYYDSQYNLMYDNVFSIMGKRGSGKTSVIYTLRSMLEEKNNHDIILPVVMPELIPESCEMIGWILALLEETVNELDGQIRERECAPEFVSCKVKRNNSLKREYEEVKELCFSKGYNVRAEESFSEAVINTERQTQNSFDFAEKLAKFWTSLKNTAALCSKARMGDENKQPLIFIMFDDVDLVPEKLWHLFSTIIKYLSHPNIIVLITADEDMLFEVVKNTLKKKMGNESMGRVLNFSVYSDFFNESDKSEKNAQKTIEDTARLYVAKILPPSCRYYIESFDECSRKAAFIEQLDFKESGEIERVSLQKFLADKIDSYLCEIGNPVDNFLYYETGDRKRFLSAYLLFFGNTSRQLANERLILDELMGRLIHIHQMKNGQREHYMYELYHALYYFVFATLNASGNMQMSNAELKNLVNQLVLFQPEDWGIYVNYRYIIEDYNNTRNGSHNDAQNETLADICKVIKLFVLLFLVENILIAESAGDSSQGAKRTKIHGQIPLVAFLDQITRGSSSLVRRDDSSVYMTKFLYTYQGILENPEILLRYDDLNSSSVRKYLSALPADVEGEITDEDINFFSTENPNWFRTIICSLYLANKNIYSITDRTFSEINIERITGLYDEFLSLETQNALRLIKQEFYIGYNVTEQERDYEAPVEFGEIKGNSLLAISQEIDQLLDDKYRETIGEPKIAELSEQTKKWYMGGYINWLKLIDAERYGGLSDMLNSPERTEEAVINLRARIVALYGKITRYGVSDYEEMRNCFTGLKGMTRLRLNERLILPEEDGKGSVSVDVMNRILNMIAMEITRSKREYEYYTIDISEGSFNDIRSRYYEIIGMLYLKADNSADRRYGTELVLLHKVYSYLLVNYLKRMISSTAEAPYMDKKKIPYSGMYKAIVKLFSAEEEPQDGEMGKEYLRVLIKRYINEGVDRYFDSIYYGTTGEYNE